MLEHLTTSPFFIGISALLINVGSRYIAHEFSDNDKEYSENILLRRIAIFAVCFAGTQDLIVSIMLTAAFVILASGFIRGKSILSREGMTDPDSTMRAAAGLFGKIDAPAYDKTANPIFT